MHDYPLYNESDESEDYRESSFHLDSKDKPTARRPTWHFRYRGEETGEGEISLYSDRKVHSLTFKRGKGDKLFLEGAMDIDFAGHCRFTGEKVMNNSEDSSLDVVSAWEDRSEEAYENARVNRWR